MRRMPWTSATSPSFQLRINHACNMSCKGCYKVHKDKGSGDRPVAELEADLELAATRSKLHTVVISGAETTLHPGLCDIVAMVHRHGLKTTLVSNGLLLDDAYLARLKAAGLDTIMFHVDEGQRRPDLPANPGREDFDGLRASLAKRIHDHGIAPAMVVTLYRESLAHFAELIRFFLASEHTNLLLVTHYIDFAAVVRVARERAAAATTPQAQAGPPCTFPPDRTTNEECIRIMQDALGLEPSTYIPASKNLAGNPNHNGWVTYFIPVARAPGGFEYLRMDSSLIDLAANAASRLFSGKNIFYLEVDASVVRSQVLLGGALSGHLLKHARFLRRARGAQLFGKRIVLDNGPVVDGSGNFICADFCPIPAVKDKKLVPVCISDFA